MSITTLGEFIVDEQKEFPGSSGEFSSILSSIRLAGKIVSQQTNKAGLAQHILGSAGSENIQALYSSQHIRQARVMLVPMARQWKVR